MVLVMMMEDCEVEGTRYCREEEDDEVLDDVLDETSIHCGTGPDQLPR